MHDVRTTALSAASKRQLRLSPDRHYSLPSREILSQPAVTVFFAAADDDDATLMLLVRVVAGASSPSLSSVTRFALYSYKSLL